MLLTEFSTVRWNGINKKHFTEKGYEFTGFNQEFIVKTKDLMPSCEILVDVLCDYCGKTIVTKPYKKYTLHRKTIQKDCCQQCQHQKHKETMILKYGVENFNQTDEGKKNVSDSKRKHDIEYCREVFKSKDFELLEEQYVNNEEHMRYICNKHKDKGIQTISFGKLLFGRGCYYCGRESMVEKLKHPYEYVKSTVEADGKTKLLSKKYDTYNSYNLKIKCECGNKFIVSLNIFEKGKTKCNICTMSRYAKIAYDHLLTTNMKFETEYTFDELLGEKDHLRFDFAIFNYSGELAFLVEIDGEFHFEDINKNGSLERQQKYDNLKNIFCKNNGIPLVRIPYWQHERTDQILNKWITKYIH